MSDRERNNSWDLGESIESPRSEFAPPRRRGRGALISIVVVALLAVVSFLLYQQIFSSEAFPKLPPGRYAGKFTGIAEFAGASDWVLTISDDYKKIEAFFLGIDGIGHPAQRNGSGYLVIQTFEQNLILKGISDGAQETHGIFEVEGAKRKGEWSLAPVERLAVNADQSFRDWMSIRGEIIKIARDSEIAEQLVPAQKAEIEELSQTITDESALKDRRIKRAQELQRRLTSNEEALRKAQKDATQSLTQLRMAQKVSAKGKLVTLARDSLERETRWARSILVGSPGAMPADMEDALRKAEEIKSLKDALLRETESVSQLSMELEKSSY